MKTGIYDGPQNRLAVVLKNKSEKVFDYGIGNTLPNVWMDAVYDSGTATRCVAKRKQFIQADGFVDKECAAYVVNSKQKGDDLLAEISGYAAMYEGFALLVRRTIGIVGDLGSNKIAEIECLPFETVRVGLSPDQYQVNATYGGHRSEYKPKDARFYPAFNLNETPEETQIIMAQQQLPVEKGGFGGYRGNVLYVFEKGPGKNRYPIPVAYSGLEDILSDASLSSLELENLETGFMPSAMLFTKGQMDDQIIGKDGLTDYGRFDAMLKRFTGRGNRSKLFHAEYATLEDKPELIQFDIQAVLDGLDGITSRVASKIYRHFGVPGVLIEPQDNALGNGGLLLNAVEVMNGEVNPFQRLIQRTMQVLLPQHDWAISTLNIIRYLPPEVTKYLSKQQVLKMYGIAEETTEAVPVTEPAPDTTQTTPFTQAA